jgi:hypothetical protein
VQIGSLKKRAQQVHHSLPWMPEMQDVPLTCCPYSFCLLAPAALPSFPPEPAPQWVPPKDPPEGASRPLACALLQRAMVAVLLLKQPTPSSTTLLPAALLVAPLLRSCCSAPPITAWWAKEGQLLDRPPVQPLLTACCTPPG